MKNILAVCCVVVGFTAFADAPAAPAAGAMDMSKMGPASRKPTNEKQTKKEITEFFTKMAAAGQKGDMDTVASMHDYPLFMTTDDAKGVPEAKSYSKEDFVAMMKPFYENMPKDTKTTHKSTVTVLSDSLVNVVDDFTMTMGKVKIIAYRFSLDIKFKYFFSCFNIGIWYINYLVKSARS